VVEVVSKGSRTRDRVHKLAEYEAGGVPDYWVIDPDQRWAAFYALGKDGRYKAQAPADGLIRSTSLPGFWIREQWVWDRPAVSDALAEIAAT
jgi:Uma2 family endonuclease